MLKKKVHTKVQECIMGTAMSSSIVQSEPQQPITRVGIKESHEVSGVMSSRRIGFPTVR